MSVSGPQLFPVKVGGFLQGFWTRHFQQVKPRPAAWKENIRFALQTPNGLKLKSPCSYDIKPPQICAWPQLDPRPPPSLAPSLTLLSSFRLLVRIFNLASSACNRNTFHRQPYFTRKPERLSFSPPPFHVTGPNLLSPCFSPLLFYPSIIQ